MKVSELAKHHNNYFPAQVYEKSRPFSLMHSEVWGDSQENNFEC